MSIYNSCNQEVFYKDDYSPVTTADLVSHKILSEGLSKLYNFPIVSEENPIDYNIRSKWNKFWLIDPLDGTKDFIAKNDEFTINVALIVDNIVSIGVVYIPVTGSVYYAEKNKGAFKNDKKNF